MNTFKSQKLALISAGILVLLLLCALLWPLSSRTIATTRLLHTTTNELQPLLPATSALMKNTKPNLTSECDEVSHSLTETHLFCQDMYWYTYGYSQQPESERTNLISTAATLDKALQQNGWEADRPQDQVHAVAAAIPTAPHAPFQSASIPFHKNVGAISCNLTLQFDGSTDGISLGTININEFLCRQNISYFTLHTSNYKNTSFGP